MAKLLRSLSLTASSRGPTVLARSSTVPELFSTLREPTLLPESSSTPLRPSEQSLQSHTLIHAQWIEGLTQYAEFRLHSALSTFKGLLRDLRSIQEELSNPAENNDAHAESAPHGFLPLEEIALLYINIALIHGYLGSYYLSAAAFEEALLLDEASAIAWFGLGVARFYLRELGASKRAFGKCLTCFVTLDEDGERRQEPVLTYKVWAGRSTSTHGLAPGTNSNDSNIISGPWQPFKSILGRGFPGGQWALERPRVEWNWRIALFERNYVRKGVARPGSGKWGMNGIPAGVIFGPTSHLADRSTLMIRAATDPIGNGTGLGTEANSELRGQVRSWTGGSVKQKLGLLQKRLRGKKASSITQPSSPRRTQSSGSTMTPQHSNKKLTSIEGNASAEKATPGRGSGSLPAVLGVSLPFMLPKSQSRPQDPYEVVSQDRSMCSDASIGRHAVQDMVPMFPRRRSSLRPLPARHSYGRDQSSRDSMFPFNNAFRGFESIEEETVEGEFVDSIKDQRGMDDLDDVGDHTLEDVSPKDMRGLSSIHGTESNVIAPGSMLYGNTIPTIPAITIPQTAASSRFGSDSFMTDNISPLSPRTRSAMFPRLFSDAQSPSSRRPSYATDVWGADMDMLDPEEGYGDGGRRRSSAMITFTPATPERTGPVSLLDKKERMSITGRTCLGEWEWEAEYERWQQGKSVSMEYDDDDDDIGSEMLRPVCFEG